MEFHKKYKQTEDYYHYLFFSICWHELVFLQHLEINLKNENPWKSWRFYKLFRLVYNKFNTFAKQVGMHVTAQVYSIVASYTV